MRILRTIIVENDAEIIKLFKQFEIENAVLFSILEIVQDVYSIIDSINTYKPDLLIVGCDDVVFDAKILDHLSVHKPKLINISKDKNNAYDSFKNNAIDFLLKPIDNNVLIISLYKAIKVIEMELAFQNDTIGKIKTINSLHQNIEHVAIASVDKIELLKIEDIVFCKADGKYTEFYVSNDIKKVSSRNLGEYATSFDNNFFRIHHSYVVNVKHLIKIIKKDGMYCELSDGHILPVAKRRQEEFIKFINL